MQSLAEGLSIFLLFSMSDILEEFKFSVRFRESERRGHISDYITFVCIQGVVVQLSKEGQPQDTRAL